MPDNRAPRSRPLNLRKAARELLGPDWLPALSYMLDISERALQRWANGQNTMPEPVATRVAALLAIARESRREAAADRARRNADAG